MTKGNKILITGASGLLGAALVKEFLGHGFEVLAQYHSQKGEDPCQWLDADFSDLAAIRLFLNGNRDKFENCHYLINNYGPITQKDILHLQSEDFIRDFHHNLVTTFEITRFFLGHTQVKQVVNLGFETVSEIKPYRNVLTYALAKNALLLLTQSLAKAYFPVRIHMVSPITLMGAAVKAKGKAEIKPKFVAKRIYSLMMAENNEPHIVLDEQNNTFR